MFVSAGLDPKKAPASTALGISLASGVIAGVAAAIISHPADTLLSKVNKAGAGGEGPIFTRLGRIAAETGIVKLCTTGLAARCVMIGTLTAGQFGIFDIVMGAVGAKKVRRMRAAPRRPPSPPPHQRQPAAPPPPPLTQSPSQFHFTNPDEKH